MCREGRRPISTAVASDVNTEDRVQATKPYSSIPQPPRLPFFGHTYLYRGLGPYRIERYHDALRSLHAKYGPLLRQQLQGGAQGTVVHVFDAEDVRAVMNVASTAPKVPPIQEGSRLYRVSRGHSVGLGNLNGAEWKPVRRAAQSVLLQPRRVEVHLPGTDSSSKHLITYLDANKKQEGNVKDLYKVLARWFVDTAGEVLYHKPLGGLTGSDQAQREAGQWIQANFDIFRHNAELKVASPLFKIFPIKPWRKLVKAEDLFYNTSTRFLNVALREITALSDAGKLEGQYTILCDLLAREEVNRKDLIFFVNSLVSDGLATVPSTLQAAIHCLSHNPEVQERAYQEVQNALGSREEPMTAESVEKLSYIKAIVKETFRLYPTGTELSRILPKDMVLSGYLVPAGTVVDLNHSCMLRNERYFPEPLRFRPERWLRGEDATENAALLTPFGHGPRMCVGRRISQQAMYVVLARILQSFNLKSPPNDPPYGQVYATLLFPDREVHTRFISRH
ncbi:hypothetical protein B566_EDAN001559 [Ephemera danica]|nr:hypothetical protein B566_EDAN001559 [Ephemera danica]